jgi:hypothetical protein
MLGSARVRAAAHVEGTAVQGTPQESGLGKPPFGNPQAMRLLMRHSLQSVVPSCLVQFGPRWLVGPRKGPRHQPAESRSSMHPQKSNVNSCWMCLPQLLAAGDRLPRVVIPLGQSTAAGTVSCVSAPPRQYDDLGQSTQERVPSGVYLPAGHPASKERSAESAAQCRAGQSVTIFGGMCAFCCMPACFHVLIWQRCLEMMLNSPYVNWCLFNGGA